MESELNDLFDLLEKEGQIDLSQKIALLISQHSFNSKMVKLAQEHLPGKIEVDVHEMESLINPDKFEFPEPEIGTIGVDLNEEII